MKALIITNMYPPHHLGGYELSCMDVVERWRARGHTVSVLTTTMRLHDVTDPPGERLGVDRAAVWRDLSFYWDDHVLTSPPPMRRLLSERANQKAVNAALDHFTPDVVSVWSMGAINLALLQCVQERGIPIVFNLLDEWLTYERRLDAWTRIWRSHRRLGRAVSLATGIHTFVPDLSDSLHCFCSDLTRRRCAEAPVWPCRRYEIAPLGIDRRDFPSIAPPSPRAFGWRLLYVGRIDDRKGMATVLHAMPSLPPAATLTFLGRGDEAYKETLVSLATSLGISERVTFDAVDRRDLPAHYAAADVFVFPSEWEEPFGLVPIEAMACGTPVVATGVGGSAEFLVDGDNCLLFTKADGASLSAALHRLAGDDALRARLVAGGLETADRLTADRQAEQLERLHLAEAAQASGLASRP